MDEPGPIKHLRFFSYRGSSFSGWIHGISTMSFLALIVFCSSYPSWIMRSNVIYQFLPPMGQSDDVLLLSSGLKKLGYFLLLTCASAIAMRGTFCG